MWLLNRKVNGAQCEKEIGIYDENCNSKYEASKNEKGICEKSSSNDIGTCKCLYEWDDNGDKSLSRINKECNVGIGPCSEHCNDGCCERKCAIKYPDKQQGYGVCLNIAGIPSSRQCVRYYNC
ncbi:defensin-like protein 181 isoform X2 [Gossypium australe]|uniref:Defensin-like protein n=1 Tax=Gossypium australe TaxID=47621 RepID=A0A5B6VR98_9ROSI|nr:defensin-like protein 181 isoform X2 [Gossypium australe]